MNTGVVSTVAFSGVNVSTFGGGVRNVHCDRAPRACSRSATVVPAGHLDAVVVAIGRRSTAPVNSNRNVRVPIQRQRPSSAGVTFTGTSAWSSCANVASGTIGWLNVTLRSGAMSTSPIGW